MPVDNQNPPAQLGEAAENGCYKENPIGEEWVPEQPDMAAQAPPAQEPQVRAETVSGGPPEAQAAIEAAAGSAEFLAALQVLTSENGVKLRGCMVSSERPHLQALQNLIGWTIGGYDTRPVPEAQHTKETDRLEILLKYRQPADPGSPPRIEMYDYLCDTIFNVPMSLVGPEVHAPQYQDLEGNVVTPCWVEADWPAFRKAMGGGRPAPVFRPNRYPYQLPRRPGAREEESTAQHWILWYFHYPEEPLPDPPDATIDADLRRCIGEALAERGLGSRADYIWYRNPAMSVPQVFHVQVFWILPSADRR